MGERKNKVLLYIKLVEDGESMRMLGLWMGNNILIEDKWKTMIEKQERAMERWAISELLLRGKELVLKVIITFKAWFLVTVKGMPANIEKQMIRNTKVFIWGKGKIGLMPIEKAIAPREEGGLGILSIEARNKVIRIMWLKKYLVRPETKPAWI